MTYARTLLPLVLAFVLAAGPGPAAAGRYVDEVLGFSVTLPDGWRREGGADGQDRYVSAYSPDGELGVSVRAVPLTQAITLPQLRAVFEQKLLPNATLAGTAPEKLAGLDGEVAAYRIAIDGRPMVAAAFFAIHQAKVAYILWSILPEQAFAARKGEVDAVFASFATPPAGAARPAPRPEPRTAPVRHELPQVLSRPEQGYAVRYPAAWKASRPKPHNDVFEPVGRTPDRAARVSIETIGAGAYPSPQAGAEDLKASLLKASGGRARFEQDGPHVIPNIALGGQMFEGWSFSADYVIAGIERRGMVFVFRRSDSGDYIFVVASATMSVFQADTPAMKAILGSIEIVPRQGHR